MMTRKTSAASGLKPGKSERAQGKDLPSNIYDLIRQQIRHGTLAIGERVTEQELAARFGVSRTPVRDAIARLEADGLLTNEPRRGLTVTQLSHQQIVEVYNMREILEGSAARLAAQAASDMELATLADINEREKENLSDFDVLRDLNRNFHHMIMLAAHNRYLLRSAEQMSGTMSVLPSLLDHEGRARLAAAEHQAIVEALLHRDRDAAEAAARAHVRASQKHRMIMRLQSPEIAGVVAGEVQDND
ncbi:GntR family transcriptional regulator [Rhizobium puerariae]